ncbi:Vacuolar cation/proton exchanger 3 [Lathyrus oleraceus]|uniref:Vacuolar cation/proton exchanger 3 n=1 Tax=Pisum sativum TaxID=3888 RepID=A0A9D4YE33_PEA|nr:Vacuolar cation/proton exchanger 3 [Pisum sativum]
MSEEGLYQLLLGPPSSGKTTLLLALSGKLDPNLKVSGKVTYNGHGMDEFVPQRTAAYISQHDVHIGEMTVRETLAFSARCQGVGSRYDLLSELSRREKEAKIKPDPDIDVFMKAVSTGGQQESVVTDYVLKDKESELPRERCWLDQGPREHVLDFFEFVGFKCPERKGAADFLQEVTSKKDQEQYWFHREKPYRFVTVTQFAETFQSYHIGRKIGDKLAIPFDKSKNHPAALTTEKYGVNKKELLKANFSREYLLMKRNSFVYIFKICQLIFMATVTMTLFLRTEMHRESLNDGGVYAGAIFFAVVMIMFNGMAELSMTIAKLPSFYKQRDLLFYPSWAYAIPAWILKIPVTFCEVAVWVFLTYYRQADVNSLMLLLALLCHLLPLLFTYRAASAELTVEPSLYLSRASSIVMLVAYFAYLIFQLWTHRQLFEAEDEGEGEGENNGAEEEAVIGFWSGFAWLAGMTVFIALLSEYVVDTIEDASDSWGLSVSFLSIILLPIVGNAAEHAGAIIFAFKNKLDISLGVALGSSTQIAMFVVNKHTLNFYIYKDCG